jgi:hypothetical protein
VRRPFHFEDLSERRALKLTSLLRVAGSAHFSVLQEQVTGPHFKERTGQFAPIYALDLQVSDEPLPFQDGFDVHVRIRLGKEPLDDGRSHRLFSEADVQIKGVGANGESVTPGRMRLQLVFTRFDPDPEKRRVTELHPSMGLGPMPTRTLKTRTAEELLTAPSGLRAVDGPAFLDPTYRVWSYQQSDPNGHVHGMEYVRVLEQFAAEQLARLGHPPRHYVFDAAEVLFRKPCFTGEFYVRKGELFLDPDDASVLAAANGTILFIGSILKVPPEGQEPRREKPVAIVRLHGRSRPREDSRG